jgi:hypothetical protein
VKWQIAPTHPWSNPVGLLLEPGARVCLLNVSWAVNVTMLQYRASCKSLGSKQEKRWLSKDMTLQLQYSSFDVYSSEGGCPLRQEDLEAAWLIRISCSTGKSLRSEKPC